ncbi:UNVERIFIED_CONTAM: hypothetical protein Sradi_5845300 [Sesamum radiatum]|uniref:Uncharacterized protein n=1 Tax=Sesamum radiatum TaxID=300843 RepID=A0AAW2KPP0_SESRA
MTWVYFSEEGLDQILEVVEAEVMDDVDRVPEAMMGEGVPKEILLKSVAKMS